MPTIAHVWVDKGYTGHIVITTASKAEVTVEVVSGPKPGYGFIVQPRRWVVGRAGQTGSTTAAASTVTTKPPSKHTTASSTSVKSPYCYAGLDRSQLFDTLLGASHRGAGRRAVTCDRLFGARGYRRHRVVGVPGNGDGPTVLLRPTWTAWYVDGPRGSWLFAQKMLEACQAVKAAP